MSLPSEINSIIEEYLEILRNDADYLLNPHYRVQIYKKFQNPSTLAGTQFLQWLQILTAEHVLPIARWFLPDYLNPAELLRVARGLLLKTISETEARNKLEEIENYLSKINLECAPPTITRAYDVFNASLAALSWCIEIPTLPNFVENDNEEDWMDPDADAANWACAAYAGPIWATDDFYDPSSGLEFWEWWITEAIPQAWEMATNNNTPG
jgi:hypothetical protein